MITQSKTKAAFHTLWQGGLGAGAVVALDHYTQLINNIATTEAQAGLMILLAAAIGSVASLIKSKLVE